MWISLTTILLFAVCPLTFSDESNDIIDTSNTGKKQLKEDRTTQDGHENDLDNTHLKENSSADNQKTSELQSLEETEESKEEPWLNAEVNLKWKKILHKIKHVAGKVIESAAASAAGKAIAGAILA
uniref:Putative secreted protein n=1 Tax=Panstrongylus lignarius TaxID=156445 RepID=A0A224Y113_9HEMI